MFGCKSNKTHGQDQILYKLNYRYYFDPPVHTWPVKERLCFSVQCVKSFSHENTDQNSFYSCSGDEMKNKPERKSHEKTMWPELHISSQAKESALVLKCCSHNVAPLSCWLPPDPTVQSSAEIRFQVWAQRLELSCNFSSRGQFSNAAASVTKTTPRNSSDPFLSAGQVRFPKQALKGTRDWEHTMLTTPKVHQSLFSIQIEHSDGQKVSQ